MPRRFLRMSRGSRLCFKRFPFFLSGSSSKYLLCRPRGGLNDTLTQISLCLDYAFKFKRHLIIDTMRSGILDRFDNYFEPVIPFQNLSLYMREDFDLHRTPTR